MTIKSNEARLNAPFGSIVLTFADDELLDCELSEKAACEELGTFAEHKAVKALKAYLEGDIHALDDWKPSENGTEFRRRVWKEIADVKAGYTVTYGEIAEHLGSSPRAVGGACGDNPLPIFVGCHRVVGKGKLGGFNHSAKNVSIKCWLLKHEQQNM